MIENRFAYLLFERRRKEKRNISIAEIARATGIDPRRLTKWELKNNALEIDPPSVIAICKYFKIEPCPLFTKNSFAKLHGEKQRKEKRVISIAEIARAMSRENRARIIRWKSQKNFVFGLGDIESLCKYFDVSYGGLFQEVPAKR